MLEAKTITPRFRWFQNPILFPGAAAVAVLYWLGTTILGLNGLFCLVLLAQTVLFFLLFQRPVWAMASLIVGQLTVSSFQFSLFGLPMSLRLFWTILALIFLLPVLASRRQTHLGRRSWHVIIPAIIFFLLATISNLVNTDFYTSLRYLREPATALVILCLLPAAVENERDLKILSLVALFTCSASAIVALIQVYAPSAWATFNLYEGIEGLRVTGLSSGPFYLGFMFPVVLVPIIAIIFLKGVNSSARILLILLFVLIAMGLYYSYTRIGIYSLIPAILVMIFFMKGRPKKQLLLFSSIIFAVFFVVVFSLGNRYTQGFASESSAAGRLVLWQAGLNIASDNPVLGIGVGRFIEVAPEYASTISTSTLYNQGAEGVLGAYQAHDDFLTIWSSFGIIALVVYLWLLAAIFSNFIIAYRNSKVRFFKGFTLGCIGALVALIVYSAVQNLLDSSMLIWVFGGLSIATTKIASSQRLSPEKKISK